MQKKIDRKVEGDSTYLSSIISIFFVIVVFISLIYLFGEIVATNEVERIHRKYLISMEREGCLSDAAEASMVAELTAAGVTNIDLSGTSKTPVGYGNQVRLVIKGELTVERIGFNGGSAVKQQGVRHIDMDKTGTALY